MRRFLIRFSLLAAVPFPGGIAAAAAPQPLVPAGPEPQAAILFLGNLGGTIEPCL